MYLDEDKIEAGDSVYNVSDQRYNKVIGIDGSKFVVDASGTQVRVDVKGRVNGKRRFYWHNPAVVTPRKCNKQIGEIVRELYAIVHKRCK